MNRPFVQDWSIQRVLVPPVLGAATDPLEVCILAADSIYQAVENNAAQLPELPSDIIFSIFTAATVISHCSKYSQTRDTTELQERLDQCVQWLLVMARIWRNAERQQQLLKECLCPTYPFEPTMIMYIAETCVSDQKHPSRGTTEIPNPSRCASRIPEDHDHSETQSPSSLLLPNRHLNWQSSPSGNDAVADLNVPRCRDLDPFADEFLFSQLVDGIADDYWTMDDEAGNLFKTQLSIDAWATVAD